MNNKGHEFALFASQLSELLKSNPQYITFIDDMLIHRLSHVLRVPLQKQIVLFDDIMHATCLVMEYAKKQVILKVMSVTHNTPILPKLTVILPLLKREALDEVIYACRELGVTSVVLVATEKSSRPTLSSSEWDRLERVSIAAAEQSKNFSPCSFNPQRIIPTLTTFLEMQQANPTFTQAQKWYADPTGKSWQACVQEKHSSEFFICVGPEGDLTDKEKALLDAVGFTFCTLGTTILRAQQAAIIFMGLIRAGL